jgi:hypothetical protein
MESADSSEKVDEREGHLENLVGDSITIISSGISDLERTPSKSSPMTLGLQGKTEPIGKRLSVPPASRFPHATRS